PQLAVAGVTAGRGAHAQDGDATEAGYPVAAGTATADPFGTHGDPGYGPARHPPARTPEPALGVAAHLDDEDPAPWAGLVPQRPQIPQTPALRDRPDPALAPPGAPPPGEPAQPVRARLS